MNTDNYIRFLLTHFKNAKVVKSGKGVSCRCPECPDGKDPRSRHFGITIPQSNTEPSVYHCFKCHCRGIITYTKLLEWGLFDEQIAIEITEHNKHCSTISSNAKYFNKNIYNLYNYETRNDQLSFNKLLYINSRLGLNLNYENCRRLKIALNLYDILNANHITSITRNKQITDQLDSNFIGFISIDNSFLNMRRIVDEGLVYESIDKRYINYEIFNDKYDNSERFYTIPTTIDLLDPRPIKIHIAEGPFDILSVYFNLYNQERGIYTSIAGSNYYGQILYFLKVYKLINVEIHLYPDNDESGSNSKIQWILSKISKLNLPTYIHRNLYPGEKDFGVSINRIQESVIRLI